jgi:hypothetical protein
MMQTITIKEIIGFLWKKHIDSSNQFSVIVCQKPRKVDEGMVFNW